MDKYFDSLDKLVTAKPITAKCCGNIDNHIITKGLRVRQQQQVVGHLRPLCYHRAQGLS